MLKQICVLGGSGFVGTHLVNRLNDLGWKILVPTRSRNGSRTLWMIPRADVVECDIHDEAVLKDLFRNCAAVVNLVGILNEAKDDGEGFRYVHQELTRKVLTACRESEVPRLLHMSALNAHPDAPSHYLRSKGIAEQRVLSADSPTFRVGVFRPSVIFGPGDGFFRRFDELLAIAPGVLPLACARARFAPVFVGDVVAAILAALGDPGLRAGRYNLCGPDVFTLHEIVRYLREITGRRRLILPLGDGPSRFMANVLEWFPGKPLSRDNFRSTLVDSVCPPPDGADGAPGLAALGITPTSIYDVVPDYILPSRQHRRLTEMRIRAHRRSRSA